MLPKLRNLVHSFVTFMKQSKRTVLLIIIVAITSVTISTTVAILLSKNSNLTVPSLGTVRTIGVEVYWDSAKENKTDVIDWSEIWLGSSKNATIYIQSISNYDVTLELKLTDWNPEIVSEYMELTWDYNGETLSPNEVIEVTLTLSITNSPTFVQYLVDERVENFNLDIHIVAS